MIVELLEFCKVVVAETIVAVCDVVDSELTVVCARRFRVIVPGPSIVTIVGLDVPEQITPLVQLQLENAYPYGT